MKTSEFIEEIKKLGYIVDDESGHKSIYVRNDDYKALAMVNIKEMYTVDTYWDEFRRLSNENKRCLLNVVLEYIKTPIEDREEEKEYRLKLPNPFKIYFDQDTFLTIDKKGRYSFDIIEDCVSERHKFIFTEKEIDNLPNQDFIKALVNEEV